MINPLLESLKARLKVSLRYFSQVVHVGIEGESFRVPLILCLSEHSLMFLDQTFERLLGEIFYAYIEKVSEQEDTSGDVIKFEFTNQRPEGIPKKMTLITGEKKKLLDFLKCCWETDHLWRLSKAVTLKVHKEKISIKRYKGKIANYLNKHIFLTPPSDDVKKKHKGYGFFLKKFFQPTQITAEYSSTIEKKLYLLTLTITEVKLLEQINSDLRSSAEYMAEKLISGNIDYTYLKNGPFIKKSNLVMDVAKWEGWEVLLITSELLISLILLRRKFIPPLMDSGQDLCVSCTGGEYANIFCTDTANSIFTIGISHETYTTVISQRTEGLLMDEETASFYQSRFKITPQKIYFAYQLIISVLTIITKQASDNFLEKIIEGLLKKPEARNPDAIFDRVDDPFKIIDDFCKSAYVSPGSNGYAIWCKKVYRYLAYCLNGGLLQNKIRFVDILSYLMKFRLDNKDASKIEIFIAKMLDIREKNSTEEFDDLHSGIEKMLESGGFAMESDTSYLKYTPSKQWNFNEIVMQALIDSGYLKRELSLLNYEGVFAKLLVYLLQRSNSSLALKLAVCQTTMSMNETTDHQALRIVLPHLLDIYISSNYTLAAHSAISLVNLSYNNREHKKFLYQSIEAIISRLNCKDTKVLSYTILLLINLSSDVSRRKSVSIDSKMKIRHIIVAEIKQSIDVVSKCFQILTLFCKEYSNAEGFSNDEELVQACVEYIGVDVECDLKIIGFLEQLCLRSIAAKVLIGRKSIGAFVDLLKSKSNLEFVKRIIEFFQGLIVTKNDENSQNMIGCGMPKVLERLMQNPNLTTDIIIQKKLISLKEALT